MKKVSLLLLSFIFSLLFVTTVIASAEAKALPAHKNMVLTIYENKSDFFSQSLDAGTAEAIVKNILIRNGYPVVNEAQLKKIKKNKAAWLAFQGDTDALLRLGRQYNVRIVASGKVSRHVSRKNAMGLYTGTAAISMEAYSTGNGKYLFSDSANGKALGYSPDEASEKALQQASKIIAQKMTGHGEGNSYSPSSTSSQARSISLHVRNVSDFSRANEILSACKGLSGTTSGKISQYGGGSITISLQYRGDGKKLAKRLSKRGLSLTFDSIGTNSVKATAH